jgi:flagellar motor switch protein FliN/FliY
MSRSSDDVTGPIAPTSQDADTEPHADGPSSGDADGATTPGGNHGGGMDAGAESPFPPYLQSLLQIQVPLSVTLVSKRQPLQRILELGPGSIVPFDKPCTEPLTLEVAGESIAQGEVVKVGDKFGLRLTSLVLPAARLRAVERRRG